MRNIVLIFFALFSTIAGAQLSFNATYEVLACAVQQTAPADALLKPGLRVNLICEEEPSLNREYTITQDGLIVLSFIGAIEVGGLTEEQAAARISEKLIKERIIKKATIKVKIVDAAGLPIKFFGAVKLSGETPHREGMKLSDIIAVAEPTEAADLQKVEITDASGKVTIVDLTLETKVDPELRPGDRINFPIRNRPKEVYVLGGVGRPGAIAFEEGMTVAAALDKSGGVAANGDFNGIVLERDGTPPRTLLRGEFESVVLMAGDRIKIPVVGKRYVIVEGGVSNPGSVTYSDGMMLSQAVNAAGGTVKGAKINKVKLITPSGKQASVDLEKIQRGMMGDIPIEPGDRIVIGNPSKRTPSLLQAVGGVLIGILIFGGR